MSKLAKKYVNEELSHLRSMDSHNPNLANLSRNLNLLVLQGKIAPVFHREKEIETIQKLLLRRTKPNVLLTGPAGCGKTAIAEALAAYLVNQRMTWLAEQARADQAYERALDKWKDSDPTGKVSDQPVRVEVPKPPLCDAVVYDLSMNAMVSGTKYRGEFEEKLQKVIVECQQDTNIIVFIDEIHQMCTLGKTDANEGMGQILKPALARAEIRVIGATTTEESSTLKKDKALARRFSEIEINPLVGEKAIQTAEGILRDYEKFHSVSVEGITADQILEVVNYHIGGVFPNNFIDVVDETMSGAKFEGKTIISDKEIKATLSRMTKTIII